MNTISEFYKQISTEDTIVKNTLNYFNEIMLMYNLIGKDQYKVSSEYNDDSIIFRLESESNELAKILYKKINNSIYTIYNIEYTIYTNLEDNNTIVIFIKNKYKS